MVLPIYVVDAFAEAPFSGNPAGVVPLMEPIDDGLMQSIAMEMNHAETAFVVDRGAGEFDLRWFTPTVEVDLCGHATLAAAHILLETGRAPAGETIRFNTKSSLLQVSHSEDGIVMLFPAEPAKEIPFPPQATAMFGSSLVWTGRNRMDCLIEVSSACTVREMTPEFETLATLGGRGVIVTAQDREYDFVSRFFAPNVGVDEDPVTGSAHCCLGPYWASRLGKKDLVGYQASRRSGVVRVTVIDDRQVTLRGSAVTVLEGNLRC